jgi:diadenosine tetraphosphatase ApaH/serine/threonine PP2A family protein phosphatase
MPDASRAETSRGDRGGSLRAVLALIYDVHGNLPALEAVLADAREHGANRFLLGGDLAAFGGWPLETVERLRGLDGARSIRGNVERWTASPADAPPPVQPLLHRCAELLGDQLVAELAALPESLEEGHTLYCHGSPASDVRSFLPAPGDDDEELLAGATAERVVFGHTHIAFRRDGPGGVHLVNPGSVGMPFDGDHRAAYAVVHPEGGIEERRVAYDHEASARAVRNLYGEPGELPARRIEQARFDVL